MNFHDLIVSFEQLGLQNKPVLAHASLRAFGNVEGGAESVVTAMTYTFGGVMMPTHTYKAMITPASGPANNGINYAREQVWNRLAEPFHKDMPADPLMGKIPETLRHWPDAKRSSHPILSFAGINAAKMLATQTLENPFAPIGALADLDGWIVLMGVDHTANTSIHYAEKLAGRPQFVRWALTQSGTVTVSGFPGCSAGFEAIEPEVRALTKTVQAGSATLRALPVRGLVIKVYERLKKDPLALLCDRTDCERCNALRKL